MDCFSWMNCFRCGTHGGGVTTLLRASSQAQTTPFFFLDLPRELRDKILELAIFTDNPPPQKPEVAGEYAELLDIEYTEDTTWGGIEGGRNVLYQTQPSRSAALALLLVSHSVKSQTQAVLARSNPPFELDVMLVEGHQLWATWVSSWPVFCPKVDRVHTSFRIFPKTKPFEGGPYQGFFGGCGAPAPIYFQLYALLERSLRCGPVAFPVTQEKGFTSIQVLELNVLTPSEIDVPEEKYKPLNIFQREQMSIEEKQGIYYVVRPEEWFATIQGGIVSRLLGMYRDAAPFGQILYERIGQIRFMHDGEIQKTVDLAQHLANLKYSLDCEIGQPKSREKWYGRLEQIHRVRQERGLPVLPFKYYPQVE